VYKRCSSCGRNVNGRQCATCGTSNTNWAFRTYIHEVPCSEQAAAELDAARVDRALVGRAPTAQVFDGHTRDAVRARAQRAADQTRGQRIADVVRRSRDLGIGWD
jgi:hypothetical protein